MGPPTPHRTMQEFTNGRKGPATLAPSPDLPYSIGSHVPWACPRHTVKEKRLKCSSVHGIPSEDFNRNSALLRLVKLFNQLRDARRKPAIGWRSHVFPLDDQVFDWQVQAIMMGVHQVAVRYQCWHRPSAGCVGWFLFDVEDESATRALSSVRCTNTRTRRPEQPRVARGKPARSI